MFVLETLFIPQNKNTEMSIGPELDDMFEKEKKHLKKRGIINLNIYIF